MRFKQEVLYGLLVFVLTLFFLGRINIQHGSDNDMSRLAGVISVARYKELNIDRTIQRITIDRVEYKGKRYSSKPPVLHVVLGKIISFGFKIKPVLLNNDNAIYRASAAISTVFPLVGVFVLFYFLLVWNKLKKRHAVAFSLFLVLGTLLFSYSRYLTNHILETFLQLCIFALIFKIKKFNEVHAFILGFLLSALFVIDVTYGFVAVPVTLGYLYLTRKEIRIKKTLYLLGGALPLAVLHFYLSYVQFEILVPPQLFPEIYFNYYMSNQFGKTTGMEAQNHPLFQRYFNYTFGTYGFFLYQPFLLFAFFLKKNWRNPLWIYVVVLTFGYVSFNAIMQPDYGGSAFGPRRFLPLIPLLFFYVIKNIKKLWKRGNKWKITICITFVITFLISLLGYYNTWSNWDYLMGIDESRDFYFPLLYTIREVLRMCNLDWLLNFTYEI